MVASSQEKQNALVIISDLQLEKQAFLPYDTASTGKYQRELDHLIEIRASNNGFGVTAIQNVLQTIKARPEKSALALLLQEQEISIEKEPEPSIPELPDQAKTPRGFLPTFHPTEDWFSLWDNSPLQSISPWLADYIAYSNQTSPEGYTDFHVACGLWVLSTIAARRLYAPLANRFYTPLAIAMVARTSLFAKTTTAQAAMNVMKHAGMGWLLGDDETTPQRLLSDMAGKIPPNYEDLDSEQQRKVERRLGMSGQIGWYYDEFNQLINAMTRQGPMSEFAGLLRKLDNCPDEYRYSTKSGGQEIIAQPYLPLLASTTPANLRKHASKSNEFWHDGFWARFAFITPPSDAWKTATMEMGEIPIPTSLLKPLVQWNQRLGVPECHIEDIVDEEGRSTGRKRINKQPLPSHQIALSTDAYRAYKNYREALRTLIATMANQDLDGSYARLADKALRIAALVTSLNNQDCIDFSTWALAQEITEMFRRNLHELYAQMNTTEDESPLEDAAIDYLKNHPEKAFTARELSQNVRKLKSLQTAGISNLLATLEQNGIVESRKEGKKVCYSLAK